MGTVRLIYRSMLLIIIFSTGTVLTPLFQRGTMKRSGLAPKITSMWHRVLTRALGIRINVHGEPHDAAALYVANHTSWFDIPALGAHLPLRFLSKAEVRSWPLIGWLASSAGTLYIKRGGRHASNEAIATMARALSEDQNVCLFAEGTTTDGHVRKFHGRLMQSAIDAGCCIQPVAIHYPPATDEQQRVHPAMLYVGDTTIGESCRNVLRAKNICANIYFLPPIDPSDKTRDELAQLAQSAVAASFE
jgi:1-acyl-sn-glycerol-3-phosphate acyltransferase